MASSSVLRTNRPGNRLPEDDLCQLRLLSPDMRLTWVDHPKMRVNLTIQKWWLQRFYQKETRYGKITTEPQEWGLDNFSEQYGFHVKFCRVCISVHQCLDHHDPAIPQSCNRMIFFFDMFMLDLAVSAYACEHSPVPGTSFLVPGRQEGCLSNHHQGHPCVWLQGMMNVHTVSKKDHGKRQDAAHKPECSYRCRET